MSGKPPGVRRLAGSVVYSISVDPGISCIPLVQIN